MDPEWYKPLGITLALCSGFFIGASFIFKKKGIMDANRRHGKGAASHGYLKSPMWWAGLILSKRERLALLFHTNR